MNLSGVLFFPVTPFDGEGALAEHIARGLRHGPGAVFVACGMGEFSALPQDEQARAVAVAVEVTQGAVPVVAGAGGPLGMALFAFAPEIATAYFAGDTRLLTAFYAPLVELRSKAPGYAASLVKAGLRLRGLDVGPVRAPLTDLTPEHLAELDTLIKTGLSLVAS
ncbi:MULTISPECIES: dihydrodipicolinate synthase family protein [Nonomuraea]|uniref:Dihydrodipicolinate synthase family protein n=1 Tax=Nonomuraea mangrovi TaxID=2316207 RepID=A0ABW4TBB4_9ACTN